jgi:H+-transporting ATPase
MKKDKDDKEEKFSLKSLKIIKNKKNKKHSSEEGTSSQTSSGQSYSKGADSSEKSKNKEEKEIEERSVEKSEEKPEKKPKSERKRPNKKLDKEKEKSEKTLRASSKGKDNEVKRKRANSTDDITKRYADEDDEEDIEKENQLIAKELKELECTEDGLTTDSIQERVEKYGRNELSQEKENPILQFFKSLWNPLSWTMEVAAIVSIVLLDYADFALVIALLLVNATITFLESRQASNAIDALMQSLAPTCLCYRDGELKHDFNPAELVPGDVILIRIGYIIPADCLLLHGHDTILVDQSAITGESLPIDKRPGSEVLSGSIVKRGEIKALVTRTGENTVFGKTAMLTNEKRGTSQFQKILTQVSWFCIVLIVIGVIIELAVQFGGKRHGCSFGDCPTILNSLVLIVGGIPIAMPTVLSVTLAVGAHQLARHEAIVCRLSAIEDLSGMDVLCSDKTGTLTKNELTVNDPVTFIDDYASRDVLFMAALSVPKNPSDPIDTVLIRSLTEEELQSSKKYEQLEYHPFHPKEKVTSAKIKGPDGKVFYVKKGFPNSVLNNAENCEEISGLVNKSINKLGKKGYRWIGVAISEGDAYYLIGLIPLFDPPREDTKEMLDKTKAENIDVKMVTGDQLAIAQETARQLGLKTNIITGDYIRDKQKLYNEHGVLLKDLIEEAGGFAQVYPEDKYYIVSSLHKNGHIVGMTGDGVNDTAALKKSDIGIAVAGATDAARSAADIVLKTPGLSVIVEAIIGSRKIFQRMKSYCIYSISMAVRIVITFVILTTVYDWYFPTIATVLLAILNDGCMISISRDRVTPSREPDIWHPKRIFGAAIFYGLYLGVSTISLFHIAQRNDFFVHQLHLDPLTPATLVGLIYTQLSVGGLATIFITRSYGLSFLDRPGVPVICAFIISQVISSVIGAYGMNGFNDFEGCGWGYVLVAWIWSAIWYFPLDFLKTLINFFRKSLTWKNWTKQIHNAGPIHPSRKSIS